MRFYTAGWDWESEISCRTGPVWERHGPARTGVSGPCSCGLTHPTPDHRLSYRHHRPSLEWRRCEAPALGPALPLLTLARWRRYRRRTPCPPYHRANHPARRQTTSASRVRRKTCREWQQMARARWFTPKVWAAATRPSSSTRASGRSDRAWSDRAASGSATGSCSTSTARSSWPCTGYTIDQNYNLGAAISAIK